MTEARWPKTDTNFIDSPKATVDDVFDSGAVPKGKDGVIDAKLPDNLPANWLDGAKFWYLQWYNGWFASNLKVKAFDPNRKRITLDKMIAYSDRPIRKGLKFTYVLSGNRALLTADHEWAYEEGSKTLFLRVPGGAPESGGVEVGVRSTVLDLNGSRFVHVENITFIGGTIQSNATTADCLLKSLHLFYTENSDLGGKRNELRDSEIAYSQGKILSVSGERNRLVNNYFHDMGERGQSYGVWVGGKEQLVAYNTFDRAGEYLLNLSTLDHCQVVHNFFSNASLIARDSGSIYSLANGGNSEIAYNRFMTDYRLLHCVNGIYIDSRGSHFIIHHNVLPVIAVNPSKTNILFYHNTIYRYVDYATNEQESDERPKRYSMEFAAGGDFAGTQSLNNLYAFDFTYPNGMMQVGNLSSINPSEIFADASNRRIDQLEEPRTYDFTLRPGSPAIHAGVVIPGLNGGSSGKAPDVGAYEYGQSGWLAGHDFNRPRDIAFQRPHFFYANLLENPGFELGQLAGWTPTGTRSVRFQAGQFAWTNEKLDIWSHSGGARLGEGANGLEQAVAGLTPGNRYMLWAWVKPTSVDQSVTFGIRWPDGSEESKTLSSVTGWVRLLMTFDLPKGVDRGVVFVKKTTADAGSVFFDETSLTRLWPVQPKEDIQSGVSRFKAIEDTYVYAGEPEQIFGYRTEVALKQPPGNASNDRHPYFKFDLSPIKGRAIQKATLRLFLSTVYTAGMPSLAVNAVPDETWVSRGSGAVTWKTAPKTGDSVARWIPATDKNFATLMSQRHGWITFDITNYVRARLAQSGIVSISISDPEKSGKYAGFATSQLMMAPPFQTFPPAIDVEFSNEKL